ncbi:MAG TPA: RidA family protein [Pseudomonadales bacterium]|nr:RidA family protein [Pseudomonadales bacterium]
MPKDVISTNKAPAAIGTYSQAVRAGNLAFVSGQIPLIPETMEVVEGDIDAQIEQVFSNLSAICEAMGARLDDVVKFTVYLTDLVNFPKVNAVMEGRLTAPYPARAAVEVSALPKGVNVEVDAIVALGS